MRSDEDNFRKLSLLHKERRIARFNRKKKRRDAWEKKSKRAYGLKTPKEEECPDDSSDT